MSKMAVPVDEIVELYHAICPSYPKVIKVTSNRKRVIASRWKEYGEFAQFELMFRKAEASTFLKGNNSRGWRANFDWLLNEANMIKVLEGNYDDKGKADIGVSTFTGKTIDFGAIERKANAILYDKYRGGADGN